MNVPRIKLDRNAIQEKLEVCEQKVGSLEEQLMEMGKLVASLKMKGRRLVKGSPKNKKAEKVDEAKKKVMQKHGHGGKILDIIGNKKISYCTSPLSDDDIIFESNPYTKPLEWNLTNKRWMGHDQVTVETAFKQPAPKPKKQKPKAAVDAVVDLDGMVRHQEHKEYRTYINQYN